jgi:hypothetical protein
MVLEWQNVVGVLEEEGNAIAPKIHAHIVYPSDKTYDVE